MIQITSLELWDSLEGKVLLTSRKVEKIDSLLSSRLVNLVNHLNGNLAKNNQFVCIESIEQIVSNISKEDYYRSRKYNQDEMKEVVKLSEELSLLLKVLMSEHKAHILSDNNEKEVNKAERLPNINTDKAITMYEIKK